MTNEEKYNKAYGEMEMLQASAGKLVEVVASKKGEVYTTTGILEFVTPFGGISIQETISASTFIVFIGVERLILSITETDSNKVLYENPNAVWTETDWDSYQVHTNMLREEKYGTTDHNIKP